MAALTLAPAHPNAERARSGPEPAPPAPTRHAPRPRLPFGWPLTFTLVGYPVWWLMGIAGLVPLLAALVMAAQLLKSGMPLRVRRGFGWWAMFLGWAALGVFLLQVSAPHAIIDHSSTRYLTFAFRLSWYLTATIALIYVYNFRHALPAARVIRAFGWLFVTVVGGGILGTAAGTLDFPSLLEFVVPARLTHIQYVHDLIHPVLSQRYSVDGAINPRASAPFAYTNEWGLNYACLLPFFVQGWIRNVSRRRRAIGIVVLAASAYPVLSTQNRGMWIALSVIAVVLALRSASFGRLRAVGLLALAGLALLAVAIATPVGSSIMDRLEHASSNTGRAYLGTMTVESVAERSPVVGLGSTRNVEGSIYSIAGGDTATCSLCTPPALGTQGQFWLVIFTTGLGGALFYLAFLVVNLYRGARRDAPAGTIALVVIMTHLLTMFVYDAIGIELITLFAAIGLLWSDLTAVAEQPPVAARVVPDRDVRLNSYVHLGRSRTALVCLGAIVGANCGVAWTWLLPPRAVMQTDVMIPYNSPLPGQLQLGQTLDTAAGLLDAPTVRAAVGRAVDLAPDEVPAHLSVAAKANTRILLIRFAGSSDTMAAKGSLAAARALLALRSTQLVQARDDELASLAISRKSYERRVRVLDRANRSITPAVTALAQRDALAAAVRATPTSGGFVAAAPHAYSQRGTTIVHVVTGATAGIVIMLVVGAALPGRGRRRSGRSARNSSGNLNVPLVHAQPGVSLQTRLGSARPRAAISGRIQQHATR